MNPRCCFIAWKLFAEEGPFPLGDTRFRDGGLAWEISIMALIEFAILVLDPQTSCVHLTANP